jgi:hypothetical protein
MCFSLTRHLNSDLSDLEYSLLCAANVSHIGIEEASGACSAAHRKSLSCPIYLNSPCHGTLKCAPLSDDLINVCHNVIKTLNDISKHTPHFLLSFFLILSQIFLWLLRTFYSPPTWHHLSDPQKETCQDPTTYQDPWWFTSIVLSALHYLLLITSACTPLMTQKEMCISSHCRCSPAT